MTGGDRHRVEQAKSHCLGLFGMVAGRTAGDKGIVGLAGHHVVDCGNRPADRGQRHLQALLRSVGIGLDLVDAILFFRNLAHHRKEMLLGMGERDRILIRLDSIDALQPGKVGVFQRDVERAQPVGPFGMSFRRVVFEEDRVLVKTGGHGHPSLGPAEHNALARHLPPRIRFLPSPCAGSCGSRTIFVRRL